MEQFVKRWQDNPLGEAAIALSTAMFAGSYGQMAYGFIGQEMSGETVFDAGAAAAVNAFWPVVIVKDAINIWMGQGQYEGMTKPEKFAAALRRW